MNEMLYQLSYFGKVCMGEKRAFRFLRCKDKKFFLIKQEQMPFFK